MNIKLTPLFSAVALVLAATAPTSFATAYTKATFTKTLTAQLKGKKGNAALTTASAFLKKALTDPKNKALVATFTQVSVAKLKPLLKPTSLQVTSATKLVDAVANGYFTKKTYNGKDAKYLQAITAASKSVIQKSLQTTASANKIFAPINKFNTTKKGNSATALKIKQTVYVALKLPKPVS